MDFIGGQEHSSTDITCFQSAFLIHICVIDNRSTVSKKLFSFVQSIFEFQEISNECSIPGFHHTNPILSR